MSMKLVLIKPVTAMIRDRCWIRNRNLELKNRARDANTIKLLRTKDGVGELIREDLSGKTVFGKQLTAGKEA